MGERLNKWTDSVNDCLKKRGLDTGQAKTMKHDRNEWQGFVMGEWYI